MTTVPALTDRTEAQRWAEVRDEDSLWGDLRPELLAAVRIGRTPVPNPDQ